LECSYTIPEHDIREFQEILEGLLESLRNLRKNLAGSCSAKCDCNQCIGMDVMVQSSDVPTGEADNEVIDGTTTQVTTTFDDSVPVPLVNQPVLQKYYKQPASAAQRSFLRCPAT
jgi:hypothetical protein